jgi:hypothetical protein
VYAGKKDGLRDIFVYRRVFIMKNRHMGMGKLLPALLLIVFCLGALPMSAAPAWADSEPFFASIWYPSDTAGNTWANNANDPLYGYGYTPYRPFSFRDTYLEVFDSDNEPVEVVIRDIASDTTGDEFISVYADRHKSCKGLLRGRVAHIFGGRDSGQNLQPLPYGEYTYKLYYGEDAAGTLIAIDTFEVTEESRDFNFYQVSFQCGQFKNGVYPEDYDVHRGKITFWNDAGQEQNPFHVRDSTRKIVEYYIIFSGKTYTYVLDSGYDGFSIFQGKLNEKPPFETQNYYYDTAYCGMNNISPFVDYGTKGWYIYHTPLDPSKHTTFIVTKGAEIGVYKKMGYGLGAIHFQPYESFPLTKVETAPDGETYDFEKYDYYTAGLLADHARVYHCEASIPGVTAKASEVFLLTDAEYEAGQTIGPIDLTPIDEWAPQEANQTQKLYTLVADLYTNMDDTGSVNLSSGEGPDNTFTLDTIRVWQAMYGESTNHFIEPDYEFEVFGGSVSEPERTGSAGRERTVITAAQQGVSVVKITYGPQEYAYHDAEGVNILRFNGISPENTGVVVVNVDGGDGFDTGITARNDFDTYYFDRGAADHAKYSFTPPAGASVRVHKPLHVSEWNTEWESYSADGDGAFTIKLHEGRNIVEVTYNGSRRYHVIKAKGIEVVVSNKTRPGEPLGAGDTASVKFEYLESPIAKIAGIYNPGYPDTGWVEYRDESDGIVRGEGVQYSIVYDNAIEYTVTDGDESGCVLTGGRIHMGQMGQVVGRHRDIPVNGVPADSSAVSHNNDPYFGALPDIVLIEPVIPPASDAGVSSVTVRGVQATPETGNIFSVELPADSALPAAEDIVITPNDSGASAGEPESSDGGATWTFTVMAEDGADADYTIYVTVAVSGGGGGNGGDGEGIFTDFADSLNEANRPAGAGVSLVTDANEITVTVDSDADDAAKTAAIKQALEDKGLDEDTADALSKVVTLDSSGRIVADAVKVTAGLSGEDKALVNPDAAKGSVLLFEATVQNEGDTAAVPFYGELSEFAGVRAGDMVLLKLIYDGTTVLLNSADSLSGIESGEFVITDGAGNAITPDQKLSGDEVLVVAIADDSSYDWRYDGDGDVHKIIDPLVPDTKASASGGGDSGTDSAGGCDAGFGTAGAAFALASLMAARRRKRGQ